MNIEDVSFNPRAREGRDKAIGGKASPEQVSIHAPARGATATRRAPRGRVDCFNPRARVGRDIPR